MKVSEDTVTVIVVGGLGLLGVWWFFGKGNAAALGKAVATAAVDVATGAVTGAAQAVGIPQTSISKCRSDCLAGDSWAASFSCPLSDFAAYSFHGKIPPA